MKPATASLKNHCMPVLVCRSGLEIHTRATSMRDCYRCDCPAERTQCIGARRIGRAAPHPLLEVQDPEVLPWGGWIPSDSLVGYCKGTVHRVWNEKIKGSTLMASVAENVHAGWGPLPTDVRGIRVRCHLTKNGQW